METEQNDQGSHKEIIAQGLHVLAKPIGPVCDIKCDYCLPLGSGMFHGLRLMS